MSGTIRNVAILAFLAGAYASNPDISSFQRYVEGELKKDGSTWLERKVVSHLASNLYQRDNYYLFSVVRLSEDKLTFIGLFGNWFKLPSWKQASNTTNDEISKKA